MKIVVIANEKGGVGKTTTSQNLGIGLARLGIRVALVDMDHQHNLTDGCGGPANKATLMDVLTQAASWKDTATPVYQGENGGICILIPSSKQLAAFPTYFAEEYGKEFLMKEALKSFPTEAFDVMLVDCSPSLDLITINAFVAGDEVLVPVQCEVYALQGLESLEADITRTTKRLNPSIKIQGILATMFDGRKRLSKDVLHRLQSSYPKQLYKTIIRDSVALAEAPSNGISIYDHDPTGYGAADYTALSREFCERMDLEVKNG